jgi:16S rRNA processing protein RimM
MTRNPKQTPPERISGSPNEGGPEFLVVGKLHRPHGVRGDIIMSVWTDFPERLEPGISLFVGDEYRELRVQNLRWYRQDILISFCGYANREEVGELRNHLVYVRADDRPALSEGEFYLHQLIGLQVIRSDDNRLLGVVEKIIETGANDVFLVRSPEGKELLLPDIDSVILNIDLERGEIIACLLPGLLPE